jgi:CheY-like chemotaxis protein
LKLVRRGVPDLLVIDLHLPALSGIDVCMHLRGTRIADRCTILCTSAHADRGELDALRALGFTRFVPKGDEISRRLPPLIAELTKKDAARWRRMPRP